MTQASLVLRWQRHRSDRLNGLTHKTRNKATWALLLVLALGFSQQALAQEEDDEAPASVQGCWQSDNRQASLCLWQQGPYLCGVWRNDLGVTRLWSGSLWPDGLYGAWIEQALCKPNVPCTANWRIERGKGVPDRLEGPTLHLKGVTRTLKRVKRLNTLTWRTDVPLLLPSTAKACSSATGSPFGP